MIVYLSRFWLLPQVHLLVTLATNLVVYVLLLIVDMHNRWFPNAAICEQFSLVLCPDCTPLTGSGTLGIRLQFNFLCQFSTHRS